MKLEMVVIDFKNVLLHDIGEKYWSPTSQW